MKRRLVTLTALLLAAIYEAPPLLAREPEAVAWNLVEAAREGRFLAGPTPGGDVRVLIGLFPSDDQFAKAHLLVRFPGCGEDSATPNRPILNLEGVLQGRGGETPRHPEQWEDPGPRWRMCVVEQSAFLLEGQGTQFSVYVDFLRAVSEGLSPRLVGEVHVLSDQELERMGGHGANVNELAAFASKRRPDAHVNIDLFYRLSADKGVFVSGGYHDVFGKPGRNVLESAKMTDDYLADAANLPIDLLAFRSNLRIPGRTTDDQGRLFRQTLRRARSEGSGLVGDSYCHEDDADPGQLRRCRRNHDHREDGHPRGLRSVLSDPDVLPSAQAVPDRSSSPALIATYRLSGRFSTKWTADHSLHPGFGFRVEAWSDDFLGTWNRVASDWVQSDGTWSLTVPPTLFFQGNRLRMYYVTRTDYYDAQDIDGGHYAWRDPDQFNVPTTFSTGHRFADTDGGTFSGVGEMVDAAMYTWSRLYWNGGINPVRSAPINLIAPNTGLACGGTSPWSCAGGGSIWLISAHAAQAQVVAHELGHQLNYKFWNDKGPANTGGSHSLGGCYPGREGMTLYEGFADFLAGWVGYPGRNVAEAGFGAGRWALGWELEDRAASPSCTNGWENEVWVARTFWDLHDTRSDGDDILWFNFLGAVPALYLGNGVANSGDYRDMRFYENIYRNAASAGHQGFITDIFDQNRQ
jgi:hypothetical protein